MRMRTGAALLAVLTLACEVIPTSSADDVRTNVVLDLTGALSESSDAHAGQVPNAAVAMLFWEYDGKSESRESSVVNGIATFGDITVPKGSVTFQAGAKSSAGTVLHWSTKVTRDIEDGFDVPLRLAPIYPLPEMRVVEPTEWIPVSESPDFNVRTVNAAAGEFKLEILNARDTGEVITEATLAQHPVEMTWTIADDPRISVSRNSGTLGPGQSETVTVTETQQSSDSAIFASLNVSFHFVREADSFTAEVMELREVAVQLIKTTGLVDTTGPINTINNDTLSWHPPGPIYNVGEAVGWTYAIRNVGTMDLSGIELTDSLAHRPDTTPAFTIDCPELAGPLGRGQMVTCQATGTVASGPYQNVARVKAGTAFSGPAFAADTNWHQGRSTPVLLPKIDLQVSVNTSDADFAPGVLTNQHQSIAWDYVVRNDGRLPLTGVSVTTSSFAPSVTSERPVCGPFSLAVGATKTCSEADVAIAGQFSARAQARGTSTDPETGRVEVVSSTDETHYNGGAPLDTVRIDIEKTTNGVQADTGPGPTVTTGGAVVWRYVVRNLGNVDLTQVVVSDSDPTVFPACVPASGTLSPGDSIVCSAAGIATAGQYGNEGTATGAPQGGAAVMDADSSHYLGQDPPGSIDIQKATNGHDADVGPGPAIPVGNTVIWTYVVTNLGPTSVSNLVVTDSDPTLQVHCAKTVLAPGGSITCEAVDTATAGLYGNVGTATAMPVGGSATVMDADSSHYEGVGMQSAAPAQRPSPNERVWGGAVPSAPTTPAPAEPEGAVLRFEDPLLRLEDLHRFDP